MKAARLVWLAQTLLMGVSVVVLYGVLVLGGATGESRFAGILSFAGPTLVAIMGAARLARSTIIRLMQRHAPPEGREEAYAVATLMSTGFIEGPGIMLMILCFVSGAALWLLLGGAVTVGLMTVSGPSREEAGLDR